MVNVIRHKRITKSGVSNVKQHWRKNETSHPLSSKEFSGDVYVNKDGHKVKVTNIMMDTRTPYWVSGDFFSLEEFRTKREALKFAKSKME